ncbi:MAG: hypothetical protein JRF32_05670 [Deltaproteobacteria bacterium]|nr:hypothetical protein [Deltaproteobacteria bacterium]MBW2175792.1 hypothetical protein [Deltaproteobacteria bacterium]MBW2297076.1 hypothetical protein [Deltaproteobacteria bacterium]MBW2611300.1 hypothetical protein [Deltaproteobacteria bacterium]MBW2633463.1 hypothetical protein [Deltaproteobacteria bacterium]
MTADKKRLPPCFGDLETVFPEGADGFRHSPEACLQCAGKTECLRSAMQSGQGLRVRETSVDRAYASGMIGFFERWSQKKELDARRKLKDGKG